MADNFGVIPENGCQTKLRVREAFGVRKSSFANVALLNGTKSSHKANFAINWPNGVPQVDQGTLGKYPKNPNKNFNLSLIEAEKEKNKENHKHKHKPKKRHPFFKPARHH